MKIYILSAILAVRLEPAWRKEPTISITLLIFNVKRVCYIVYN